MTLADAGVPAPSARPVPAQREPVLRDPPLAPAFDVAAIEHGAAVVHASGSVIWLQRLDDRGRRAGRERRLYDASPRVVEIAALGAGRRLAVAWRAHDSGARARVHDFGTGRAGAVLELGASLAGAGGRLAIAKSDESFVFLAPGANTACSSPRERDCVEFRIQRQQGDVLEPWRTPLALPSPCADAAVGLAFFPLRHHYAVCSERLGKPVTTVFSIQPEPQYAAAEPVLDGCRPLRATELDGELVVVGDCFGRRKALRFGAADVPPRNIGVSDVAVGCDGKSVTLRDPASDGLRLTLAEPRSRLEALLPPSIAPDGARAAWTGRALVVGVRVAGELELRRYTCSSGELERKAVP